jgi:hypothetical protein
LALAFPGSSSNHWDFYLSRLVGRVTNSRVQPAPHVVTGKTKLGRQEIESRRLEGSWLGKKREESARNANFVPLQRSS